MYAICLQIFRHIAQKSLAIRQYACGISRQSAEKSDYASYAQALFSVSLSLTFIIPLSAPEVNDFQPIFSGITSAHKFILRDCGFPFEHLHGCLVGKIGKHFFFKLFLSIKNSSENVPYFWNCFVFTLLKNCAMLFAGGENRCL